MNETVPRLIRNRAGCFEALEEAETKEYLVVCGVLNEALDENSEI